MLPTLLRRTLARSWASVRSEILWALIFVFMVGLGPFPGLLALGFHTGGVLGKLVGEVLEAVDPRPFEALQSTGASRLRILLYGVLPQSAPRLVSYALYRWEVNIRAAAIVGFVGAGGLGQRIHVGISLFLDHQLLTLILAILRDGEPRGPPQHVLAAAPGVRQ